MSAELIDALDEQGNFTGRVLAIGDLHAQELWHGVAHIWVYNKNGRILLQLRDSAVKWAADKWDLAGGGHISSKETPLQAAIREAKEELGLVFKPEELSLASVTTAVNVTPSSGFTHRTHEWNYLAESDVHLSKLKLQAGETADAKWFSLDRFEKDLKDLVKSQNYAPRSQELYDQVIAAIRQRLVYN